MGQSASQAGKPQALTLAQSQVAQRQPESDGSDQEHEQGLAARQSKKGDGEGGKHRIAFLRLLRRLWTPRRRQWLPGRPHPNVPSAPVSKPIESSLLIQLRIKRRPMPWPMLPVRSPRAPSNRAESVVRSAKTTVCPTFSPGWMRRMLEPWGWLMI